MPKYKVGDLASLFPKPTTPVTETGKQIHNLFEEFYSRSNSQKFNAVPKIFPQQQNSASSVKNGQEKSILSGTLKKKRKFHNVADSTSDLKAGAMQQRKKLKSTGENSKKSGPSVTQKRTSDTESYFPRNNRHFKSKKFSYADSSFDIPHNMKEKGEEKLVKSDYSFDSEASHVKRNASAFEPCSQENKNVKKAKKHKRFPDIQSHVSEFESVDKNFGKNKNKKYISSGNFRDTELQKSNEKNKPLKERKKMKKIKKQVDEADIPNKKVVFDEEHGENMAKHPKKSRKKSLKQQISSKEDSDQDKFPLKHEENAAGEDLSNKSESKTNRVLKKKAKSEAGAPPETDERLSRTLFVGNLPVTITRPDLKKLFLPFGPLENCRLRGGIPTKKGVPKRVADIKHEFHHRLQSLIGYVVFKNLNDAVKASKLNGTVVADHHIVVNLCANSGGKNEYDDRRSVFIGNLPFDVQNDVVWRTLAQCGEVEAVRVIRDRETGSGKGFGYVLFQDIQSKQKALSLNGMEIAGRAVRISAVENKKKNLNKKKSINAIRLKHKKENEHQNRRKSLSKVLKKHKMSREKKKIVGVFKKFKVFNH